MFSFNTRSVSSIAILTLALNVPAGADQGARLITVAAENGFTYQWIPTEAGAMLARPGVRIIIRAGRLYYDVNDATPIADSAPRFDGRDLIISPRLAEHLRELARKYPYPAAEPSGSIPGDPPVKAPAGALTLHALAIPGRDALALRGTGPVNAPLTLTLTAEVSTDMPVLVLSRKSIVTATDGTFSAEVEYGQESHVGTTIAATLTTLSGTSSAQARFVVGITSPQITSSQLDTWPKK